MAGKPGYLDKLFYVYPMTPGEPRELSEDTKNKLISAYRDADRSKLIDILLNQAELFPLKDSYIGFLRRDPSALKKNPQTVKRLGDRLLQMSFEELVIASTLPKETNRQIGPLFKNWLPSLGFPILEEKEFLVSRGTAILAGSDTALTRFSNKYLGSKLKKGLDLVLKKGEQYLIAETKFITAHGGHQNAQFNDAMNLIKSNRGSATRLAILDGVLWVESKDKLCRQIRNQKGAAVSALLLSDFIKSL